MIANKSANVLNTDYLIDTDISSLYPSSIRVVLPAMKYWHKKINSVWRIDTSSKTIHAWMSECLPDAVEYQGDIYLNEQEFMMLVLKFGPGQER